MAPASASRKNLSATATVLLLLIIVASCVIIRRGTNVQALERQSYKGPCVYNPSCYYVCRDESMGNIGGKCHTFRCWCDTECPSEIVTAASAPIQP
ncbi:unnamed protein product [Urochloa decumbens]|uniref:Knottins-like domain-containing protein n=1 Tax=Urochloa decumbens TaxID=240449 RepID=A0ABC9AM09_9POAL